MTAGAAVTRWNVCWQNDSFTRACRIRAIYVGGQQQTAYLRRGPSARVRSSSRGTVPTRASIYAAQNRLIREIGLDPANALRAKRPGLQSVAWPLAITCSRAGWWVRHIYQRTSMPASSRHSFRRWEWTGETMALIP